MFGIGQSELLLILLAVLILFGAKRIPEVARSVGKGMSDIRNTMSGLEREIRSGPPPVAKPSQEVVEIDEVKTGEASDVRVEPAPVADDPGPGRNLSG